MEDTLRHHPAIEGHLHIWNTTHLPKTRNLTTQNNTTIDSVPKSETERN